MDAYDDNLQSFLCTLERSAIENKDDSQQGIADGRLWQPSFKIVLDSNANVGSSEEDSSGLALLNASMLVCISAQRTGFRRGHID